MTNGNGNNNAEQGGFTADSAATDKINLVREFKKVNDLIEKVNQMMMVVLVAFVIALLILGSTVAGLVIDAYRFKASTYQSLVDKVQKQNTEIELIAAKLKIQIPSGL